MFVSCIRGWHVKAEGGPFAASCPSSERLCADVPGVPGDGPVEQRVTVELQRDYGGLRLRGLPGARYVPTSSTGSRVEVLVTETEFGEGERTLPGIGSGTYLPGIIAEFGPYVLDSAVKQLRKCDVASGNIVFDVGGYDRESAEVVFSLAAGVVVRRLEAVQRECDFEASVDRLLEDYGYRGPAART